MKKILPYLSIALLVFVFFWQFFVKGLLPIPSDTIIGLYHPFRDSYAKDYPNGIPFKNFLITDPVRQQYPWRELAISAERNLELPLWNPYNFAGTPLLANLQSAPFYLFNILFFVMPFITAWSLIVFLGPLLGGIFLFLYLNNLRLSKWASLLGAIAFSFSGFFVAWMEWGTITHVGLWLPLILLAIDKIFIKTTNSKFKIQNSKLQFKIKTYFWPVVFTFSLTSAFFAGHLQTFFYLYIFTIIYFFARWIQYGRIFNILFAFLIFNILFLILTSIQWIPTLQFISLSARNVDVLDFNNPGWFIPWQHLIQFVAPDFFGNPTTLNYWGVWNYGELVGYVGIVPLVMAVYALFFRHDKKTFFFGSIFFISLVFSLPTFFAKLPYILNIPFLSTTQPTRLLLIADFSLAILASFGLDYFIRSKKREMVYPLIFIFILLLGIWGFVNFGNEMVKIVREEDILVAKRNLVFPTLIFIASAFLLLALRAFTKFRKSFTIMIYIIIVAIVLFDLFRFGLKFTPFTNKNYLFPKTKVVSFLQKNLGNHRMMTTDSRILPPNFSTIYRLKSIDGYDPLYLLRYGELIAASERKKADISPPFGFNRIITPHNFDSKIIDLLGVKFVLSLSDLNSDKLKKIFEEGKTIVYENINVFPRTFFVSKAISVKNKNEAIEKMLADSFDLSKVAIVENSKLDSKKFNIGKAWITEYSENKVVIETDNLEEGFLILTDTFYPIWKVKVDRGQEKIHRADYNFRGVIVPAGKHRVEFYNSLF